MGRVLRVMAAAITLAAASLIPSTVSASAAGQCGGVQIWRGVAKDQGRVVGELDVYWNAASGTNCARFNRLGGLFGDVGQRRFTYVRIVECAGTACNSVLHKDVDSNLYAYYAGPVIVPGRGHCVRADGGVYLHGAWHQVGTGSIGCG